MSVKDQLSKLKENWLLLIIAALFLFLFASFPDTGILATSMSKMAGGGYEIMAESAMYDGYAERSYSLPSASQDFAPEVEERKIVQTARISNEVERGTFYEAESRMKNIATSANAYILNQNVNKYGTKRKSYYTGSYQIKIDATKYNSIVAQLKEIGEVQSFNENQEDITGSYTNTEIEIQVEKERLKRYQEMYSKADKISDKIDLNDRIFSQERRIKYLEDSLKNMGQRVDYSTIYLTLTEKRSEYMDVVFVKISELVKSLVGSFNTLLNLLFVLLPWAALALIIRFVFKILKKK